MKEIAEGMGTNYWNPLCGEQRLAQHQTWLQRSWFDDTV